MVCEEPAERRSNEVYAGNCLWLLGEANSELDYRVTPCHLLKQLDYSLMNCTSWLYLNYTWHTGTTQGSMTNGAKLSMEWRYLKMEQRLHASGNFEHACVLYCHAGNVICLQNQLRFFVIR